MQAADTFFNPVIGWNNPVQEGRLIMEELGEQQVQLPAPGALALTFRLPRAAVTPSANRL